MKMMVRKSPEAVRELYFREKISLYKYIENKEKTVVRT